MATIAWKPAANLLCGGGLNEESVVLSSELTWPQQAAVAIIAKGNRLLTIQRSAFVRAPGEYCFPGGGIESGETVEQAIKREMIEELGISVQPIRSIWRSRSPSGVELFWWQAKMEPNQTIQANAKEVAAVHWLNIHQIRRLPDLLASNVQFFESLERGEFKLDFND